MSVTRSGGFPKRKSVPAQYGVIPPNPPSAGKSSSFGGAKDEPGAFLQYIHCGICEFPFYAESGQEARQFFMTSCGHIVCNDASHNHKRERCSICGQGGEENPIEVFLLDDQLPEELQHWFMSVNNNMKTGNDYFMRNKFQFRELSRHIKYLNGKLELKSANVRLPKNLLNRSRIELKAYKDLQVQHKELMDVNAKLMSDLAEANRKLAARSMGDNAAKQTYQLQQGSIRRSIDRPPSQASNNNHTNQAHQSHRAPFEHVPYGGQRRYQSPLESEGEGHRIGYQDVPLSKRQRTEHGLEPSSTPLPFDAHGQPLKPLLSANSNRVVGSMGPPPFPHQHRRDNYQPQGHEQVYQDRQMDTTPRPVPLSRTNLEQFRFEGNSTPQPRPFLARRPGSVIPNQKNPVDSGLRSATAGQGPTSQLIHRVRSMDRASSRPSI